MAQGGPLSKMKYLTPEAFRAGLEARAKKLRDESGEGLDMIRRKLAFEAFLCRVTPSAVPLVLKGGYLMHLRYQVGARPTKDLDTALQESQLERQSPKDIERRMREALQIVAASPADDFFPSRSVNRWRTLVWGVSSPVIDLILLQGSDREFLTLSI